MASFRFVASLAASAAVCLSFGPGCGTSLGGPCSSKAETWCDGNAVATCTLSPDCISHPDTCNQQKVVADQACPADRPVCTQVTSAAVCEVSGVKETCKGNALDGQFDIGPVGDFNGDGLPDFVGTTLGSDTVFLGQADGSFAEQPTQSLSPLSDSFFAADMNGDGRVDLGVEVIVKLAPPMQFGDAFYVAAGRGDGTFAAPVLFAPAPPVEAPLMAVADLDGDGVGDLAGIDAVECEAYVTLGGPAPKALPPQKLASPCPQSWGGATAMAAADFDGDGKADLLIPAGTGYLVILGGSGGRLRMLPPVNDQGDMFFAGDVDEDGHVDLATTTGGRLALLHGHGDGTFDPPALLPPSPYREDVLMLLTDVDGDRHLDLVARTDGFVLELRRGLGAGAFGAPSFYDVKGIFQAAALTPHPDGTRDLLFDLNVDPQNLASRMFLSAFPSHCF